MLSSLYGQEIKVGDTTGIIYHDFEPDVLLEVKYNPGVKQLQEDSIDVNFDGIQDLRFVTSIGGSDLKFHSMRLEILNDNIEACRSPSNYCTNILRVNKTCECDVPGIISYDWYHYDEWSDFASITSWYPTAGEADCWFDFRNITGYVPFRYLLASDTLKGWVEIQFNLMLEENWLKIKNFGIEGNLTSVSNPLNDRSINVYPNPAYDEIFLVSKTDHKQDLILNIFDSHGRLIKSRQIIEDKNSIDISSLNAGVYFLRIEKDNHIYTQKLVKL